MLQTKQILNDLYQLEKNLAQNPGHQTWIARDLSTNPPIPVIVKLLAFSPQMQWEEFKLFEREAEILKQLNHPHIPRYRNYFAIDKEAGEGLYWFGLVQDYIPGASLQNLLDRSYHFSQSQVKKIAIQILNILIYLHGLNPPILHRDIKPSNVIVGKDKQIYLVDFGSVANPNIVEGATFTVVGTAGYAPLEQFWGKAFPASDLYALGATLVHLLTGITPANLPQCNLRIQFRDKVSIDRQFLDWIEMLIEPDLDRRFSSAVQALKAFNRSDSLPKFTRPDRSNIKMKKTADKLVFQVPRCRQSLLNILTATTAFILAESSRIILFILTPLVILFVICIHGLLAFFLPLIVCVFLAIFLSFLLHSLFYLIPFIFLMTVIIYIRLILLSYKSCLSNISDFVNTFVNEIHSIISEIKFNLLNSFGIDKFSFDQNKFLFKKSFLTFVSKWGSGKTSQIKNLEVIPFEGIIIETGKEVYRFGKKLTESEREWLVQEIKDWLRDR
ncbi:serine/threonine protein kinase [Phormidium sp. LEGE 05292]|uniref:serine/threonine protein kinase n=1 Tax=[Phormidium] sp. LEGE 05292 TaxID=767427 RepID=UPI00187FD7FD|nr:serine/threonine-protein kinase [Phormidium sp. LEGE 05292]MBE9228131.1 serine/threonine protein kinase [Phormidium sp. LEGE 05292]